MVGKEGTYNALYTVPHMWGTVYLSLWWVKGEFIMFGIAPPPPTCGWRCTPDYSGRGGTYNAWYSVPTHVGDGVSFIMERERRAYNVWYTVPPHVGGCVPLIMVGEDEYL